MKHKLRFAILLTAIILLSVPLVIFLIDQFDLFERPRENIEDEIMIVDGVPQSDLVYIKDAYFDGDERKICYTTVNNKNKLHVYRTDCIWIEKKVGDQWEFCVDEDKFKLLLAEKMNEISLSGFSTITFIIGGSLGLDPEIKQLSHLKLSFSKFTFPHQLMRLILVEQVYRAFKINHNETYHK